LLQFPHKAKGRDLHSNEIVCNNATQRIPHKAMPILHDKTRMVFLSLNPLKTHSVNGSLMVTDNKNSEVVTGRA
jgi:hypothetical protein